LKSKYVTTRLVLEHAVVKEMRTFARVHNVSISALIQYEMELLLEIMQDDEVRDNAVEYAKKWDEARAAEEDMVDAEAARRVLDRIDAGEEKLVVLEP